MTDVHKGLVENIRKLREERGWSMYQLEKECGVSRTHLGRIEERETSPTIECLSKIAEAFGVGIDVLLYGRSN